MEVARHGHVARTGEHFVWEILKVCNGVLFKISIKIVKFSEEGKSTDARNAICLIGKSVKLVVLIIIMKYVYKHIFTPMCIGCRSSIFCSIVTLAANNGLCPLSLRDSNLNTFELRE